MKGLEILNSCLLERFPILVVGAGFSLGVKNNSGKSLPESSKLSEELFDNILKCKFTNDELEQIGASNSNTLKEICDIISDEDLNEERNKYLTKRFSGCKCDKDDYHMILKKYNWNKIYSFNIDDLIENIYGSDLKTDFLFKLHGSVLKPVNGYIFSNKEYRKNMFLNDSDLFSFSYNYYHTDIIFLGTEFQEEDVLCILERYEMMKFLMEKNNYFFISPKINNKSLLRKIEKNSNFHYINMNTKQFLLYIQDNICRQKTNRLTIKNYGAKFLDEEFNKREEYKTSIARLYQGETPLFYEIEENWDIKYPLYDEWEKKIINQNNFLYKLVCVVGDSFSGKTCIAKRMTYDLYNRGYKSLIYPMNSSIDAVKYKNSVLAYLQTLPDGSKCVIYAENMSHFFPMILDIMKSLPKNILHLVFITTSNKEDYLSKQYVLENEDCLTVCNLNYTINGKFADNIYYKLSEKIHLGKLLQYGDNKKSIVKYIKNINDIVEVLYVSQEGRKFTEYFQERFNDLSEKDKNIFCIMGLLTECGIAEIDITILNELLIALGIEFNSVEFIKKNNNFIKQETYFLKIRCFRIIKQNIKNILNANFKMNIIFQVASFCSKIISDREESLKSEIYQKITKVKTLSKNHILTDNQILELLIRLENESNHLSYYWIQRGIANRNLGEFEEANNSFAKAITVRGFSSYHVQHAQAKNYMAWGIWAKNNGKVNAEQYFNQGKQQLQCLIQGDQYKYFGYSIHTYTDMTIKYYQLTKEVPPNEEIQFIVDGLKRISQYDDDCSGNIIKKFNDFCRLKNIEIQDLNIKGFSFEDKDIDDIIE